MLTATKEEKISTLSALKALHAESLKRLDMSARAIDILSTVTSDWVEGVDIPAAVFRRNHRRDTSLLRTLEDRRFIATQNTSHYEPQFNAFCVILADKRRVATHLFREMKQIIQSALIQLDRDPMRPVITYDELVSLPSRSALTVPALRLLSSSGLGIYFSSTTEVATVQLTEEVFKGKNLLAYVSSYLTMLAQSSLALGPPSKAAAPSIALDTFSIENLLLVEEAHKHAARAISQYRSAPDTAISSAKSALESCLKYIAHQEKLAITASIKLPELFKACRQYCGLGSDATHKMGRSIASLCTEIAEARNSLGDSHGKSPGSITPTRAEAKFVVGVALQLSDCLLERYEAHRMSASGER